MKNGYGKNYRIDNRTLIGKKSAPAKKVAKAKPKRKTAKKKGK